jgi:three-Cys-motif partner protein
MMTRDSHFEQFEDHTLLKHYILETYLKAWAAILLDANERGTAHFKRALYVDAFAGPGSDAKGQPGSPLRAAQIASEINGRLFPGAAKKRTGMQVIAIEQHEKRCTQLKACLAAYTETRDSFVHVRCGVLDKPRLDGIREFAESDPIFYFLDPFGIDGLDAALLRPLLEDRHSELLMLFSDEGAVRLHGKGAAVLKDPMERVRAAEAAPSFFGAEHHAEDIERARRSAKRVIAGHKSNQRAREIMQKAFGDLDHVTIVQNTPIEQRQRRMIDLYTALLKKSDAKYVLPFAIATEDGRHKYTLLHASKQVRAVATMKNVIHRAKNKQGIAAELILYTPIAPVVAKLRERFEGHLVRWTDDTPNVKQFVIDETDVMYHECDALKQALEPFMVVKRPLTYQF